MEQMPKEIASAIVMVMRSVGRVSKEARNQHGGYNYASVDAFLEVCNPACAEAGLAILPVELSSSIEVMEVADNKGGGVKQRRMVRIVYSFVLVHETGATWTNERDNRTVIVDHTGAQCFGGAQSYALKQYMRSLFLMPTGDKDADADEQHQAEIIRGTVKALKAKKETGTEHVLIDFKGSMEPVAAADVSDRVLAFLTTFDSEIEAREWWDRNKHGREQFHTQFPKLALDLKRRVEAHFESRNKSD